MPNFEVSSDRKSAVLFLYGAIGDIIFGDSAVSAKQFASDLQAVGKVREINLRINSPGGSVFDARAMASLLRSHPARKVVDIDGICASAATYLACAGDVVRMAFDATYMIHKPMGSRFGTAADMRKEADLLDTIEVGIVATYAEFTGRPEGRIRQLVEAETWMTGQQALDLGFAHELTGQRAKGTENNLRRFGYRNTPEHLLRQPVRPKLVGGKLLATTAVQPGIDHLRNMLAHQRLQLDHAKLVDKIERRRAKARSGR